jgi:hypothetical protein
MINHRGFTFVNHPSHFRALPLPGRKSPKPVSGCWRALSAGILSLGLASAAFAQTDNRPPRNDTGNPPSIADRLLDSPRVVVPTPTTGAGNTGYISQKKKNQPAKKKQSPVEYEAQAEEPFVAQKSRVKARPKRATPAAPDPKLVARNPSLARQQNADPSDVTGSITPLRRRRVTPEDEPFGPVGFYSGAFLIKPSIEIQTGFDSNAQKFAGGQSSWFNTATGQLQAASQWQRHELLLDLRGSYTAYSDVDGLDKPELLASLKGRIDVSSLSRIELETKFGLTTQYPASPDAIAAVKRQPNVYSFGQTAAFVQRFNRFEVTTGVGIERNVYQDGELTTGAFVNLEDRNYNEYSARLRGAYEWTPDTRPFVEVSVDRRERDLAVDFNGIARDSNGYVLRAGITLGRKERLSGEFSVGFAHRGYADATLNDVQGMIYDASLVWLATGLTTFRLNAKSGIEETSVPGASGVLRHDIKFTVEHALRRWLVASASIGWLREDYAGAGLVNDYLRTSAALTYSLNRSLALKAEYRNEQFFSNVPGMDYTANIGLIGIRLQR